MPHNMIDTFREDFMYVRDGEITLTLHGLTKNDLMELVEKYCKKRDWLMSKHLTPDEYIVECRADDKE